VRLRYAYLITCQQAVRNAQGEVVELHCTYDPETKGGSTPDGRKVKGTIHWVSARHGIPARVCLYDRLFTVEHPDADKERDFKEFLNPDSRKALDSCILEPFLANAALADRFQFERQGYFCLDSKESLPGKQVYNRIVTLKDSWAKVSGE
jgi:glutaminyl-tRNA synthetase